MVDRRRFFEHVKALVVGGMCPAWVGGLFTTETSAAEQSERLPAFEFLGHHIGDRVLGKFPSAGGSETKYSERQVLLPLESRDDWKREPYCSEGPAGVHVTVISRFGLDLVTQSEVSR